MDIRPIETYYNGYRFRSRLEARWAVFFDALKIKYRYEPEGFVLSDGTYYLPDFYLPEFKMWVEVKGVMDNESERKIMLFSDSLEMGTWLWVLMDIPNPTEDWIQSIESDAFWKYSMGYADGPYLPCICPACGRIGIEFDGRGWRVDDCTIARKKLIYPEAGCIHHEDKGYSYDAPIILQALSKARQARFEHGESPRQIKKEGAAYWA